jgi:hypothetical protein
MYNIDYSLIYFGNNNTRNPSLHSTDVPKIKNKYNNDNNQTQSLANFKIGHW